MQDTSMQASPALTSEAAMDQQVVATVEGDDVELSEQGERVDCLPAYGSCLSLSSSFSSKTSMSSTAFSAWHTRELRCCCLPGCNLGAGSLNSSRLHNMTRCKLPSQQCGAYFKHVAVYHPFDVWPNWLCMCVRDSKDAQVLVGHFRETVCRTSTNSMASGTPPTYLV